MQRRELSTALLASAAGVTLVSDRAVAGTCSSGCYPQTPAEAKAGVTPQNTAYLPGDVRRYGADPSGSTDSTSALNTAIKTGYSLYFCDGIFLTSGNHFPKGHSSWWGTGTLKSAAASNILVTAKGVTEFVFELNTDLSDNTSSTKYAISIDGSTYVTVRDAVHVQGGVAIATTIGCNHIKIRGNSFRSTALNNDTTPGVININAQTTDFEIIDNEIVSPTGSGISIFNSSRRGVIANNRISGCVGSGIYIASAQYLVIQGNISFNNKMSGIGLNTSSPSKNGYASYCTVSGNICYGNTYDGIDYNISDGGNQHAAFTTVSGNVLAGNGSAAGGTGIYIATVNEVAIVGNTMAGNHEQGIFLNSANGCTVSGNSVVANGTGMAPGKAAGITVAGSNNAVTGNTSTNNDGAMTQSYGIIEPSGVRDNCIVGNSALNNTMGGVKGSGENSNVQANQPNEKR